MSKKVFWSSLLFLLSLITFGLICLAFHIENQKQIILDYQRMLGVPVAHEKPIKHIIDIADEPDTGLKQYIVYVPYVFTQEEYADNFIEELEK